MAVFQTSTLRMEPRPDGIALLQLDVPERGVNVLNRQVLADLDAALDVVAADKAIKLLVIRGAKPSGFVAGADIREFATVRGPEDAKALSSAGQRLFDKLADLSVPAVALIHGPCLGGGLELALACDYRIVLDHPKTQLGFPEIELGLLPAWGGTQRLPRVVGLEPALQVILGGRRLNANEAVQWGLADALGPTEAQLSAQLTLLSVRALKEGKRPKKGLPLRTWRQRLLESNPLSRLLVFRGTERALRRRVPEDMPAPWEALQVIRVGLAQGMEAGLVQEREAAGRLSTTPACRNLVTLFLQREEANKLPEKLVASPKEIRRIAVVGAGVMGAGIAQLASIRGFEVIVREVNEAALAAGMDRIAALFQKAVDNRLLSGDAARQKLAAIRRTTAWDGVDQADLVIEAIIEDLRLKQALFQELQQHTPPATIVATNTSSLLVQQLQEGLTNPERVAGLHFFNPVHKMPLVEVVRAPLTGDQTVAALAQWTVVLGKTPVEVKDSPGFVVNRILMPYLYEAVVLAAQEVPVKVIDQTMRRFGMPMGPLELLDQVGLDVAAHIARAMQPLFGSRSGAFPGLNALGEFFEKMSRNGWLGQKTGLGFYRYQGKTKKLHAAALTILPNDVGPIESHLMSSLPAAVQMREARERMVLLMVNEAAACLGEGLAANADKIDLAMVMGTGWAPHRGGPLRYTADRGPKEVVQKLTEMAQRLGRRFEPCAALRKHGEKETGDS
jgi:3-hydroxyacyl-CoA dehydrogenase/enoyl-CoA hydratase/3-hydroxybutyryl-CoA epimerase